MAVAWELRKRVAERLAHRTNALLPRWGSGGCRKVARICAQPTISRLENLPGAIALKRMMAAMVELFCHSFEAVPRRILLDIDDTEDRVHRGQQRSLWNAHYDSRCFLPIHIYEATTGVPRAHQALKNRYAALQHLGARQFDRAKRRRYAYRSNR
jgi:hypothetical protein